MGKVYDAIKSHYTSPGNEPINKVESHYASSEYGITYHASILPQFFLSFVNSIHHATGVHRVLYKPSTLPLTFLLSTCPSSSHALAVLHYLLILARHYSWLGALIVNELPLEVLKKRYYARADSQGMVCVTQSSHRQAFKVHVLHDPNSPTAGGLLHYCLLHGTNPLVEDKGVMHKFDWKFSEPRDEKDRSSVLGWSNQCRRALQYLEQPQILSAGVADGRGGGLLAGPMLVQTQMINASTPRPNPQT